MKFLAVHPSPLMYTKVFLRLEPLGLELVAETARRYGCETRLIDLQVESHQALLRIIDDWRPDIVAFSLNYLANVPEVVDLAKACKHRLPDSFIVVGGHSASFIADELLEHGEDAIDAVLKGEGESGLPLLLDAIEHDRSNVHAVPGVVTTQGQGPQPSFVADLNQISPARDLLRHRRKYFLGTLDPCASIEFSRGCPWDCSFCSAWTFYGRSYRVLHPDKVVEEVQRVREPGLFIVDDVAFIQEKLGFEIGEALARKGIKKEYYLETRGDVLLRNKDVFRLWKELGMTYMFLGIEAIDAEGLEKYRKRIDLSRNFEALEFARSLGINIAINIIADTDWDHERFRLVREWCKEVPEIVNISINTPYPGTEIWLTESRKLTSLDYRLFDIQHAVLPTRMPLHEFYAELIETQRIMFTKHMGWTAMRKFGKTVGRNLMRGQTNFVGNLWKFDKVFNPALQLADHTMPVKYAMKPPGSDNGKRGKALSRSLYVHQPLGRTSRQLDDASERFVDESRGADVAVE
ncbi:MAG: hopanoid C-3 methylase HpnR [Methylomonas sp.]|nr:hopanoid C-3 methylase HpnR [Methylomonas sp.]PPD20512.1 MAG: hopanoid C-3 methylase HpnR [Methylomonas sp.]PPD26809.1 MAG: hopanoid C-3 methylase HpnR [Methylomonas sp.]PPD38673.1 MAG: hopanoid C-3 methylase HpnR [Methylomonas sp.]PPD40806.1 MAG: hopanoid C-3 methylase HpnR [Methylomonas sp.]